MFLLIYETPSTFRGSKNRDNELRAYPRHETLIADVSNSYLTFLASLTSPQATLRE